MIRTRDLADAEARTAERARRAASPLQLHWLVRLRWAAIAAQIASILGVKYLLHAPFPLLPLVLIISFLVAINIALALRLAAGRSLSDGAVALNLLVDVAALTGLLVWTGGAMNPFTTLYLLQVALAAILVPRRWSLGVALGAVLAFGGLLLARPEAIHVWHAGAMFLLHVRGMWLAFALTALCLWFFVERVSSALARREEELARAKLESARVERLAALATLAAGTAHELNTPLGTVAILAAELSDQLAAHPDARAQADQIRDQVRRCTEILSRMRSHENAPRERVIVAFDRWVQDQVAAWRSGHDGMDVAVDVSEAARGARVEIQPGLLRQALENLLDNARRASTEAHASIEVHVTRSQDDRVLVTVVDHGTGIAPEHLGRLGEPFFTTRDPGQGLGLGLFLVQATLAQHDGALVIESLPGSTRVQLALPAAA